jgi:ArsR family transcriptional regulator
MRDTVKAFKALSDETRLRILNILLERECCVCEVMQALDISQTRASRNLATLYDAGFLKLRKEGLWSIYSINKEGMKEYLSNMVEAVVKALKGNNVVELDLERLKRAERVGPGCVVRIRNEMIVS